MRLGFAIAAFLEADVLLLDEVFAVGDESFQRKCFGVISGFKQRGGTIVFVSHDASAVERLCDRAVLLRGGSLAYDGPVHEALARYRRALAEDDEAPTARAGAGGERGAIRAARIVGLDGEPTDRVLAGSPLAVELEVVAQAPLPDATLAFELRDAAGLLVADGAVGLADLGWDGAGEMHLRLDVPEPALQFGRFRLALSLLADDGTLVHRLDEGLPLLVYPDGESRGLVRLAGTWSAGSKESIP